LKNARVGGEGELAEAASAHHISGGGLVGIGRTEARHREVHVIEQVEELGAELKFHSLVDREVFDSRHIDIELEIDAVGASGGAAEVARVDKSGGGVGIALGVQAGTVTRDAIQGVGVRKVRLPADAGVHDEFLIYAPVVLSEKAAFEAAVVIKDAAALGEIGSLAEDEVGEIGSRDGEAESELAGLLVGVLYRSAHVIDLAAEVKFMAATVERDDFPDLPVVAIKLAGMAGGDIEKSIEPSMVGGPGGATIFTPAS